MIRPPLCSAPSVRQPHTCSHSDFKSDISRQTGAFFVRRAATAVTAELSSIIVPWNGGRGARNRRRPSHWYVVWGRVVLVRCYYGNTKESYSKQYSSQRAHFQWHCPASPARASFAPLNRASSTLVPLCHTTAYFTRFLYLSYSCIVFVL